jgi:hypothetical protein
MAAASNKPGGVHYALIFFVMLSIILGVTTYMFQKESGDAGKREAAAKKDAADSKNLAQQLDNAVIEIKKTMGKTVDQLVDQQAPDSPNTFVGQLRDDMRKYGGTLAESTYSGTMAKMRQQIDTLEADLRSKVAALDASDKELRALQARYSGTADSHDQAKKTAEADLRKVVNERDELIAAEQAKVNKLRADVNQLQVELDQEKDAREKERKGLQDKIGNLTIINQRLNEELQTIKKETFDVADGYIRRIDNVSNIVWLNIGDADFLKPRMTFSVYGKETPGIGRSTADIKGKIEVTRIIDAHLSEAKVISEDLFRPIAPGDAVFTPLWSPGRSEKFAVVGLIDMDGDGKYNDRDLFHAEMGVRGAEIATEVDDKGQRTPQGVAIDESFRFLILGKIPDPVNAITPEEKAIANDIMNHHKEMRDEARMHGIRVMNVSEFMDYIGYKPKQRLFRPGEDRPFQLKSGAASTGINESLGDRASSGQTGGNYSRSKSLPAATNLGKTFGRGQ